MPYEQNIKKYVFQKCSWFWWFWWFFDLRSGQNPFFASPLSLLGRKEQIFATEKRKWPNRYLYWSDCLQTFRKCSSHEYYNFRTFQRHSTTFEARGAKNSPNFGMAGKFSNGWQILVAKFPKSIDFRSNPQTLWSCNSKLRSSYVTNLGIFNIRICWSFILAQEYAH